MTIDHNKNQRILLGALLVLIAIALFQVGKLSIEFNVFSRSTRIVTLTVFSFLSLFILIAIIGGLLIATCTRYQTQVTKLLESIYQSFVKYGKINLLFFLLAVGIYSFVMIGPLNRYIDQYGIRWTGYICLILVGSFFLESAGIGLTWNRSLVCALLISALGYRIATWIPEISPYPFSLGWSEASRYYYASLFFSERLYDLQIPPTVLHPSRYLMQSLPFLIPDLPLWIHRLWQILLWVSTTTITSGLLIWRLKIEKKFQSWMFAIWVSLFLLLAPVYYHLQIIVIIVLWGFHRKRPWRTMLVVILASFWAGISRVNWFPVPGLLAATLFFLEQSLQVEEKKARSLFLYLIYPALWFIVGTASAFLSQIAYAVLSGNPIEQFSSSFSSDLLWYRLFPSATYPLGVLTGALLVCIPILFLIGYKLLPIRHFIHPLRIAGIATILFVLFSGGLVVSVKIGGGSNLHNLDAFLGILLVVSGYVYFGRVAIESNLAISYQSLEDRSLIYRILLTISLVVPVILTVSQPAGYRLPNNKVVQESIMTIQEEIDQVANNGQEVLFISERQLLMFNTVSGVSIVPDYEKVFLMEMAMANNSNYLNEFYDDLRNQRYALIVSEPLKIIYQDRTNSFGEENNAWVKRVAEPILCYYEPITTIKPVRTELLVPKIEIDKCDFNAR